MWMGRDMGGQDISVYKHGITRRYLHLSLDRTEGLRAYRYTGDGYDVTPLADAVEDVFEDIEKTPGVNPDDPRATPYDDEFRARKDRALAEAGYKVIRLE
jgi:hypothetical protein